MSTFDRITIPAAALAAVRRSTESDTLGADPGEPACCIVCGCPEGPCGTMPIRTGPARSALCPAMQPASKAAATTPWPWALGFALIAACAAVLR